jgi:hypothetical protein
MAMRSPGSERARELVTEPDLPELNNRHRDTLDRILRHPASGNIEWRQVTALLEAVGAVMDERDGNLEVTLGGETEVFTHRMARMWTSR